MLYVENSKFTKKSTRTNNKWDQNGSRVLNQCRKSVVFPSTHHEPTTNDLQSLMATDVEDLSVSLSSSSIFFGESTFSSVKFLFFFLQWNFYLNILLISIEFLLWLFHCNGSLHTLDIDPTLYLWFPSAVGWLFISLIASFNGFNFHKSNLPIFFFYASWFWCQIYHVHVFF